MTPNTSLIVLETLDQYLKYEISPPRNFPGKMPTKDLLIFDRNGERIPESDCRSRGFEGNSGAKEDV